MFDTVQRDRRRRCPSWREGEEERGALLLERAGRATKIIYQASPLQVDEL